MSDYPALEVRREYIGGNPRFDFPVRPLGWARLFGAFLIGFGVLFVWMPGRMAWQSLHKLFAGEHDLGNLIFAFFPLLFVVAGMLPIGIGLAILMGRCRVEWRDGQLRSAEILGPFRWTRRLPRKPIQKLEIAAASSRTGNAPPKQIEKFSALAAVFEDGSKRMIVAGYPKDWLLPVAEELRSYVGGGAYSAAPTQVEIVETSLESGKADDVLERPAESKIVVEERGGGVHLIVPPAGIWRGSKGLLFFAIFWNGFMVVFTWAMTHGAKASSETWVLVLFLVGFWAIGLGLLAGALNMGMRTARLTVEGGRLSLVKKGIFGTKQWEWQRGEVAAIRADASGMEVNERPVIELQIHPRGGKKVGLLAGRNEAELRWVATRLRRTLNVPAQPT